jgi:hypothetical protein
MAPVRVDLLVLFGCSLSLSPFLRFFEAVAGLPMDLLAIGSVKLLLFIYKAT